MMVLLLNAGSSSLKYTLMESANHRVIAGGLADWAGSVTHYRYAGPDGTEHADEVSAWDWNWMPGPMPPAGPMLTWPAAAHAVEFSSSPRGKM